MRYVGMYPSFIMVSAGLKRFILVRWNEKIEQR